MISLRLISGLIRSTVVAFILSLLVISFITHPSLAASHARTHGLDTIDSDTTYYLVPEDQPARTVTFASSTYAGQSWDDLRLSSNSATNPTSQPAGTPVKFTLQPTGRYTIQMQGSDKQGFTFINAGLTGVWLDQANNAQQWNIEPAATGGYFIYYYDDSETGGRAEKIYLSYDTTSDAWLDVKSVSSRENPTVWDIIPGAPVSITPVPATPVATTTPTTGAPVDTTTPTTGAPVDTTNPTTGVPVDTTSVGTD